MLTGAEGNIQAYSGMRRGAGDAMRGFQGNLWNRQFGDMKSEVERRRREAQRMQKYSALAAMFGGAGQLFAMSRFGPPGTGTPGSTGPGGGYGLGAAPWTPMGMDV